MTALANSPAGAAGQPDPHDDRVLALTRVAAAGVIIILVLAVWVLYLYPETTNRNFAWTITPTLTPLAMGAGYIMGIYFFLRVLTSRHWHQVAGGYLPITAFTVFMALATILHLDRFHSGAWSFVLWSVIYAITPFLVPFLWWRNQKTDSGIAAPGDRMVPDGIRRAAAIVGGAVILAALIAFVFPGLAIAVFPWKLTPLTSRVVAGWAMLPGVGGLTLSRERRWSTWQVVLEAFMVGLVFFALALPRAWNDLTPGAPGTWILLAFVIGALAGAPIFYLLMQSGRLPLAISRERGQA